MLKWRISLNESPSNNKALATAGVRRVRFAGRALFDKQLGVVLAWQIGANSCFVKKMCNVLWFLFFKSRGSFHLAAQSAQPQNVQSTHMAGVFGLSICGRRQFEFGSKMNSKL